MALNEPQASLADAMSDISEFSYFARWHVMTAYRLWAFVIDPSDDGTWGNRPIPPEAREELQSLSERAGGWVCWDEEGGGPRFVSLAQWLPMFEHWQNSQRSAMPRRYSDYLQWYAEQKKGEDQGGH